MTADIRGASGAEFVALIPQMRAFARSLCRDRTQADDLAQDALASAWRFRNRFTQGTSLKAWVFTILRNQFYLDRRHSWRGPDEAAETRLAAPDPGGTPHLGDIRRAMVELPDELREALALIEAAGLPYEEAATICGCPIGTIKSRVSRARRQLLAMVSVGRPLARRFGVPGGAMATVDAQGLQ